jgi:hypothetical protein
VVGALEHALAARPPSRSEHPLRGVPAQFLRAYGLLDRAAERAVMERVRVEVFIPILAHLSRRRVDP